MENGRKKDRFETWVSQALREMPERVQDLMDEHGIEVVILDHPPERIIEQFGPNVFGIFTGRSFADQWAPMVVTEPTRIELYRRVFMRYYSEPEEMKEQVKRTVLHEVGHFLGMDEEQLRELGY